MWLWLYFGWIISEILIAVVTRTKGPQGRIHDRGTLLMLWGAIVAGMTACGWFQATLQPSLPHAAASTALYLLALGLALRWLAVLSLGNAFSVNVAIRGGQRVNQSGLYSLMRHPSYSGLILIFFAVGLHARNLVSLFCAFVPTTAVLIYRIHIEEAALLQAFGPEYQTYMVRTKRLVPWLF